MNTDSFKNRFSLDVGDIIIGLLTGVAVAIFVLASNATSQTPAMRFEQYMTECVALERYSEETCAIYATERMRGTEAGECLHEHRNSEGELP